MAQVMKKKRKPRKKESERIIMTIFYNRKHEAVKINHSTHAHSAVKNAVDYMQRGHYKDAFTVAVTNSISGSVLCIMTYVDMELKIVYRHSPRGDKFK